MAITRLNSQGNVAKLFVGSIVVSLLEDSGAQRCNVWSKSDFTSNFGRAFDSSKDCVVFMNGDRNAQSGCYSVMAGYIPSTEMIGVKTAGASIGAFRLNYIVALAD